MSQIIYSIFKKPENEVKSEVKRLEIVNSQLKSTIKSVEQENQKLIFQVAEKEQTIKEISETLQGLTEKSATSEENSRLIIKLAEKEQIIANLTKALGEIVYLKEQSSEELQKLSVKFSAKENKTFEKTKEFEEWLILTIKKELNSFIHRFEEAQEAKEAQKTQENINKTYKTELEIFCENRGEFSTEKIDINAFIKGLKKDVNQIKSNAQSLDIKLCEKVLYEVQNIFASIIKLNKTHKKQAIAHNFVRYLGEIFKEISHLISIIPKSLREKREINGIYETQLLINELINSFTENLVYEQENNGGDSHGIARHFNEIIDGLRSCLSYLKLGETKI